jgi:hypothetical protein
VASPIRSTGGLGSAAGFVAGALDLPAGVPGARPGDALEQADATAPTSRAVNSRLTGSHTDLR